MTKSKANKIALEFLTKNPMGLTDIQMSFYSYALASILLKIINDNELTFSKTSFTDLCACGDFEKAYYFAGTIFKEGLNLGVFQKFNTWVKPIIRSKRLKEILE